MNWKHVLESVSASVNDDLRLRHAYLLAENRIMRQHITGRLQLTDGERKELAELGAKLGKKALEEVTTHDDRAPIPHMRAKVVFVPAVSPRPIRDGPLRHRVNRLLKNNNRKAA